MEIHPSILELEKTNKAPWADGKYKTVLVAARWIFFDEEKSVKIKYYRVPRSYALAENYPYYLAPMNERKQRGNEDWLCFLKLIGEWNDAHNQYTHIRGTLVKSQEESQKVDAPFEPNECVVYVEYIVDSPYVSLREAKYDKCSRCGRWWLTKCKVCP